MVNLCVQSSGSQLGTVLLLPEDISRCLETFLVCYQNTKSLGVLLASGE